MADEPSPSEVGDHPPPAGATAPGIERIETSATALPPTDGDGRSRNAQPPAPEDIDLTVYGEDVRTKPFNRDEFKESSARAVALTIVGTFAATIGSVLLITLILVITSSTPAVVEKFAAAISPILESLTSLATTVFGPLLAFILGYYFGKIDPTGNK
jgi:hypothetical protein